MDHFKNSSMGRRVTVGQARENLGDEADGMTDEEVQDLIDDLSVMAKWAIDEAVRIKAESNEHYLCSKNNTTGV